MNNSHNNDQKIGVPLSVSNIGISEKEYKLLADLVYERSGINLGENKKELVKARLMKRMRSLGLSTYKEYYDYVLRDTSGDEMVEMLDAISTNVTSFFREAQHFDFMKSVSLPDILERKKKTRNNKIRIWSCASSSGEEIYSILIVLLESIPDPENWDIKILGTDISTKALVVAQAGVYSAEKLKTASLSVQDRYFTKELVDGKKSFKVKPFLREMAVFRRFNLMSDRFPFSGKFDIIFCRNVMIYFDKEKQEQLVRKLHQYLEPGGYLFIGHSESIIGIKVAFHNVAHAVYKK